MQRNEQEEAAAIAAELASQYLAVRVLPDLTVAAVMPLLYTTSIILDCNRTGYVRRFCFESAELARQRFNELQSCDDQPAGYIARR